MVEAATTTFSSFNIYEILEELKSSDADFRYMALNDLTTQLSRPLFILNENTENNLVPIILDLVKSPNGGVQNMAIKCLASMTTKLQKKNLETIVDQLTEFLQPHQPEELKDIANLGLKSMLLEFPSDSPTGIQMALQLIPVLLRFIHPSTSLPMVPVDILDLLLECNTRFGHSMFESPTHTSLLLNFHSSLVPLLHHSRPVVRKRAATMLASLTPYLNNGAYNAFLHSLLSALPSSSSCSSSISMQESEKIRTIVYCFQSMAVTSPSSSSSSASTSDSSVPIKSKITEKLIPFLPSLIKKSIQLLHLEDHDELKESLLQCFEVMVTSFPHAFTPFIVDLLLLALQQVCYDPHYQYPSIPFDQTKTTETSMELENKNVEEEEEMDMDFDHDETSMTEYSDEEDLSWKVRRASASFLSTLLASSFSNSFCSQFQPHLPQVCRTLFTCFQEREPSVKLDIAHTTIQFLTHLSSVPEIGRPLIVHHWEYIVKCLTTFVFHSKITSMPLRQVGVLLLRQLLNFIDPMDAHMQSLMLSAFTSLHTSNPQSTLAFKLELLRLCSSSLPLFTTTLFTNPVRTTMMSFLFQCLQSNEPSLVLETLQRTLPGCFQQPTTSPSPNELDSFFQYTCQRFSATTSPSSSSSPFRNELTEPWLQFLALLITHGPSSWADAWIHVWKQCIQYDSLVEPSLSLFPSSLECEQYDLSHQVESIVFLLLPLLKKRNTTLVETCLKCLTLLLNRYPSRFPSTSIESILNSLSSFMVVTSLTLASEAFTLATSIMKFHPVQTSGMISHLLPLITPFLTSPSISPTTAFFTSLLQFLETCALQQANSSLHSFLMNIDPSQPSLLSKALAVTVSSNKIPSFCNHCLQQLKDSSLSSGYRELLLYTLGELGLKQPLPSSILELLFSFLESEEALKAASAWALGQCTSIQPSLLSQLIERWSLMPSQRYMVVQTIQHAIKASASPSVQYVELLWPLLLQLTFQIDEGTRNVLGECMGALCLVHSSFIHQLSERCHHAEPAVRATCLVAIKRLLPKTPSLMSCLNSIQDPDVQVRKMALTCFLTAAHFYSLSVLVPYVSFVYKETFVYPELVREVAMGPFKHVLDEGLETRKLAYECIWVMLPYLSSTCSSSSSSSSSSSPSPSSSSSSSSSSTSMSTDSTVPSFTVVLERVIAGLSDVHDIVVLCLMILATIPLPQFDLDKLVDPLLACFVQTKPGAVKQDVERSSELHQALMKTSARLIRLALGSVQGLSPKLSQLYQTFSTGPMASKFQEWLKLEQK